MVGFFSGNLRQSYPHQFDQGDESIEIMGKYLMSANDANAHVEAVLAGHGISQCVTFTVAKYLESGELVEVLPGWTRPALPVHVVYPPNRHLSAKVRAFVEWAAELFAKHPHLRRS